MKISVMITSSIAYLIYLTSSQESLLGYSEDFFGHLIGGDLYITTDLYASKNSASFLNEIAMAEFLDAEIENGSVVKAYDFKTPKLDEFIHR